MGDNALLRRIREAKDLTLKEVEERVGFSQQYVSDIERGARRGSRTYVKAFADGLGLNSDWLLVRMGYLPERVVESKPVQTQVEYAVEIMTGERLIPEEVVEDAEGV